MEKLNKIRKTIKEKYIKFTAPLRRKKLLRDDFTIISNNCWAGDVYRYFGLPYNTPTVGLYFWADDYIRFLKRMEHYLSCELEPLKVEDSKYEEVIKERNQADKVLAKLDDIEIVFLHYQSFEEAKTKWMRRAKRIKSDNLIIKFSRQNLCYDHHVKEFLELPYEKKIFFDNVANDSAYSIYIKGNENDEQLPDDISTYRRYFNILNFINNGTLEK